MESADRHLKSSGNFSDFLTVVLWNILCFSCIILHLYWEHSKLHLTNKLPTDLQIIHWGDDHLRLTKHMNLQFKT